MIIFWNKFRSYIATVFAVISCPCHLPLTLPILLALTAGTVLGRWLAGNIGVIIVISTAVFIGGLSLSLRWMPWQSQQKREAPQ